MNKNAKGSTYELKAKKELERDGWLVEKKIRSRFHSPDFYKTFDLLAIKLNGWSPVRLIQIKTNDSDFYHARKSISRWIQNNKTGDFSIMITESDYYLPPLQFECWLRVNRKWRKERYNLLQEKWEDIS